MCGLKFGVVRFLKLSFFKIIFKEVEKLFRGMRPLALVSMSIVDSSLQILSHLIRFGLHI